MAFQANFSSKLRVMYYLKGVTSSAEAKQLVMRKDHQSLIQGRFKSH